ncbi:MAG: FMN-binding protein [Conexibacter sp.]|nr:FMN-binding protein [Conexibacter sp.]
MRRAIAALVVTVAVVMLLVDFKARVPALSAGVLPHGRGTATSAPSTSTATSTGSAAARRKTTRRSSASTTAATRSAVGQAIQYQYGVVQVRATVRGGQLRAVQTVVLNPDSGRSQAIDAQVEPLLRQEALQAHSANIDVVSGATYTSQAYAQSLQSAIDRARGA